MRYVEESRYRWINRKEKKPRSYQSYVSMFAVWRMLRLLLAVLSIVMCSLVPLVHGELFLMGYMTDRPDGEWSKLHDINWQQCGLQNGLLKFYMLKYTLFYVVQLWLFICHTPLCYIRVSKCNASHFKHVMSYGLLYFSGFQQESV